MPAGRRGQCSLDTGAIGEWKIAEPTAALRRQALSGGEACYSLFPAEIGGTGKEVRLPSDRRADAVNWDRRDVKELEPGNPRAVRRGEKQLEGYKQELEETTSEEWTGEVETYKK